MKKPVRPKRTNEVYWVNDLPDKRVEKLLSPMDFAQLRRPLLIARRNLEAYFSGLNGDLNSDSSLGFGGTQGELVIAKCNQARSLTRQFVSIITKGNLAFTAHARNTDGKSLNTSRLVTSLVEQVIADQNVEQVRETLAEQEFVTGMAFARVGWSGKKGEEYVKESGSLGRRGALVVSNHSLDEVKWDFSRNTFEESDWVLIKTKENRWDIVAEHEDLRDEILAAECYEQTALRDMSYRSPESSREILNEDTVCKYIFVHKATPAVPQGKYMEFLSSDCILADDDNPWLEKLPVVCYRSAPIVGSSFGYAGFSDLLPLQELLDANISTIASNQEAYGVQAMLNPKGSNISVEQMKGRSVITYTPANATGGGKPEPLQFPQTPAEIFNFGPQIKAHMQEMANINGALRGSPPAGVTSGTAIATLSTNAIEFMTTAQREINSTIQDLLNLSVETYRIFATTPQMVKMVGRANQFVVREFESDDLKGFERVILRPVNPLTVTAAGRNQLAESMLQAGFIKSPQQLLLVQTTGNLEVLYQDEVSEEMLIVKNCEELLDGKKPPILATDNHPAHIYKALCLLHDPEVRRTSSIVQLILEYVEEHKQLMDTADPVLQGIAATGKVPQVAPPPPAPSGAPPSPNAQPPMPEAG